MSGLASRWAEQICKDHPAGDAPRLGRAAVVLLKEICARADNNSLQMWHGVKSLAKAARYSERAARYALRQLEEFPLIACVENKKGGRKTPKYELLISPMWIKRIQDEHPGKYDEFGSGTATPRQSKVGLIVHSDGVTMRWRPHCAPWSRFSEVFTYLFSEDCEIEYAYEANSILSRSISNDESINGCSLGACALFRAIFFGLLRNEEGAYDPDGPILSIDDVLLACPRNSESEIASCLNELRRSGALDAYAIPRLSDLARPSLQDAVTVRQADQTASAEPDDVWRLTTDEQKQQVGATC